MMDEDYAYERQRQKRIDKQFVGPGVHRPERYSRQDRWPDIPFVEPEPPKDGLLVLWGVCTALALSLGAYLIWWAK